MPITNLQETTQQRHQKVTVELTQELLNILDTAIELAGSILYDNDDKDFRFVNRGSFRAPRSHIENKTGAIQFEEILHLENYLGDTTAITRKASPTLHLWFSLISINEVFKDPKYMAKALKSPSYATTMMETARKEILTSISHLNTSKFDTITKSLTDLTVGTIQPITNTIETAPSSTEDNDNDPMPQPRGLR